MHKLARWQTILIIALLLVVLGGAGYAVFWRPRSSLASPASPLIPSLSEWSIIRSLPTVLPVTIPEALGGSKEERNVYIEGSAGVPQSINPLLAQYNDVDRDLCALIFEGLTAFDERGVIVPRLASSWDISPDGITYTFRLRQDVRWHDGAPFSADDVLFTINLMRDPDFQALDASGLFALWDSIKVEKLDDYTLRCVLAEPYTPFLDYTTIGILPAHLLSKIAPRQLPKAQFNAQPVGTGPFQVESVSAQQVTLKTNATYWGQRPKLDGVIFRFYPDGDSLFAAHQKGEIDGISLITPAMMPRLRADQRLNLYSGRLAKYTMILLNLADKDLPFFGQVEVRQALLYALDRQAIVNQAAAGQGLVAHSPFIPDTWAYDPKVVTYTQNLPRARQLLEQAGWVDANGDGVREKDGKRLEFSLITSEDPTWTRVVQEVARQWAAVGVKATPETVSFTRLVGEYLYPRRFEAILIAPEFAGDPDPYPFWHSTQATDKGQNWSGFSNRRADEIMEQARTTTDQVRRTELYYEFQRIFAQQVPAILLYYPIYNYAIDARVQGVQVAPMNQPSDRFRTIAQWYIQKGR